VKREQLGQRCINTAGEWASEAWSRLEGMAQVHETFAKRTAHASIIREAMHNESQQLFAFVVHGLLCAAESPQGCWFPGGSCRLRLHSPRSLPPLPCAHGDGGRERGEEIDGSWQTQWVSCLPTWVKCVDLDLVGHLLHSCTTHVTACERDVHLMLPLLLVLFPVAHLHCRTYAVHMQTIVIFPLYASLAAFLLVIGKRTVNC